MNEQLTVAELKKRLEILEEHGYGDFKLWFSAWDNHDYRFTEGVWDINKKEKTVNLA